MENDKATNIYKWSLFTNTFFSDTYIVFFVLRFSLPDTYIFLLSKIHVSIMGIKTLCMCLCVYLYIFMYIYIFLHMYVSICLESCLESLRPYLKNGFKHIVNF